MMFTRVNRALAGSFLLASVVGLSVLGAAGTADAAPAKAPTSTWTCYDYATQVFYQCSDGQGV